jgi:hypothetical protein
VEGVRIDEELARKASVPLMQEITGAKPVRDAIFIGAWFTGNSRPT